MASRSHSLFSAFLATTLLLAALPALPTLAWAQTPAATSDDAKAKAAELKKQGDAAMDGLKYGDAIAAYDAAYALNPDPALHFNKGRALQALGRFPEALDELEQFKKSASPDLLAKVPKLDELIADVRLHIAQLQIVCKVAGARVLVRDRLVGTTPITSNVAMSVGPATVEVTAEGYFPWKKSIELPPGGLLTVNVELVTKSTKGILVVSSNTAGSTVFIDDAVAGTAPVEVALDAGSHKILLRRDGYDEAETSAIVPVGERREMTVDLAKKAALTSKWWFWTGIGVIVVGGVALLTEKKAGHGDLPPGQTAGPLLRF